MSAMSKNSTVTAFKALKSIPNMKPSKTSSVSNMQYYVVYVQSQPLSERFKIRKRSKLETWSPQLKTSGYLGRALTDTERSFPFYSKKKDCTFKLFAIARK